MLQKVKVYFEVFLFFFLTTILIFLFLVATPISKDPHGFLIMNQLSDFSNNSLIKWALFGSAAVCAALGMLLMSWIPVLTPGIMSNLLLMTYFLLWVDSVFGLSIQFQTFDFLKCFGTGLFFICLFFFTLGYIDSRNEKTPEEADWKKKLVHYWLGGWICFYFLISIILVFKSFKYLEPQVPLAIGFLGVCFLNYLLLLFLKKKLGNEVGIFSSIGRAIFSCWFLIIVLMEIGQVWLR
jgi:hypothetical protein